jgi:tetratricopeptide (TPR) repeat protein
LKSRVNAESRWIWGVAVAVIATWAVTLSFGFVWDDIPSVVSNLSLRSIDTLWRAFGNDYWGLHEVPLRSGYWRPVPTLITTLTMGLFGPHPAPFHLVNLLFHVATSVAAALLFSRMGVKGRGIWIAALFFGLHPIHAEAVSFVSALPDLSAAFFGLSGLLCWISPGIERNRNRWCGTLLLLLSLLSKESSVAFLLVGYWRTPFRRKFLCFLLPSMALYLVFHFLVTGGFGERSLWGGSLGAHLATVVKLFPYAALLTVYPIGSSPTRTFPISSGWDDPMAWGALGTLLLAGYWAATGRSRSLALFLLFYLPVSNLIPAEGLLADRYLYLPTLGTALAVGLMFQHFPAVDRAKGWGIGVLLLLLALWGGIGVTHALKWRNEEVLWESAVRVSPGSAVAWNERGGTLLRAGERERAEEAFRRALALRPAYREASFNLAVIRYRSGDREGALRAIGEHLDRFPLDPDGWDLRGTVQVSSGDFIGAVHSGERAVTLDPRNWKYRYNLGLTYGQIGSFPESVASFEEARRLSPGRREILVKLGEIYLAAAEWKKALGLFEEVLQRWPGDEDGRSGWRKAKEILSVAGGR